MNTEFSNRVLTLEAVCLSIKGEVHGSNPGSCCVFFFFIPVDIEWWSGANLSDETANRDTMCRMHLVHVKEPMATCVLSLAKF